MRCDVYLDLTAVELSYSTIIPFYVSCSIIYFPVYRSLCRNYRKCLPSINHDHTRRPAQVNDLETQVSSSPPSSAMSASATSTATEAEKLEKVQSDFEGHLKPIDPWKAGTSDVVLRS
jgi:hypothetical protein